MSTNISIKHIYIYILTTRCWCPISSSVINPHIQGLWHQVCSAESIEEHAEEWLELHPCNRGSLGLNLLMSKGKKHQIMSSLRKVRPNHLWITWSHSPSDDLKGPHRFPHVVMAEVGEIYPPGQCHRHAGGGYRSSEVWWRAGMKGSPDFKHEAIMGSIELGGSPWNPSVGGSTSTWRPNSQPFGSLAQNDLNGVAVQEIVHWSQLRLDFAIAPL